MKTRIFRYAWASLVLASLGFASPEALAGNWSSQTLGQTPPMWFDYRASVNDNGVIAASRMLGTMATEPIVSESDTTVTVLPTPTMITPHHLANLEPAQLLPAVTQGAAMDVSPDGRVVGFRAGVNPAQRQALYWAKEGESWLARDLHDAVVAQFPRYAVSSAYGISALTGANQYFAVGYIREWIQPSSLSEPAIWTIKTISNNSTVTKLPLPALTPAPGAGQGTYGIANAVSELDRANRRVACGGAGVSTSYIYAQCWDVTNAASPSLITTPSDLIASSGVATSVVNRVRTIDLGGTGTGPWNGRQNIAVGYLTYTNGATAGFVWNLTTGSFDIHTALGSSYDSILADVTKQSFTQSASRQNAASGAIYHGPLVVGTSSTTTSSIAPTSPLPNQTPATVRGVYQARLDANRANAPEATTCDMDSQLPSLGQTLAMISGISRDGMRMVGDAGGQLVRMTNALTTATINVFQRNARVYTGTGVNQFNQVTYHWATVAGSPAARVFWSNAAGCDVFSSGLACSASLEGPLAQVSTVSQRRDGALATAWAYVQASNIGGTACNVTPVYAVADLGVITNPASDTTGATETWADCSSNHALDTRWTSRVGGGNNINTRSDFYHCGACNRSSDDGLSCTADSCSNGNILNDVNAGRCAIDGNCYYHNDSRPVLGSHGEHATTANQCQQCQNANKRSWTNMTANTCCETIDGVFRPKTGVWEPGGRFPGRANGNISYDRTQKYYNHSSDPALSRTSVATENWVKRLQPTCDGDLWADLNSNNWIGCGSTRYDCMLNNSDAQGPRRLRSYLSGLYDQEDWYVFAATDRNRNNSQKLEPRVRLLPPSGQDLELCVFPRCITQNSNPSMTSMRYANVGMGGNPPNVSESASPLHDGTRGLSGYCLRSDTAQTDIEVLVEGNAGNVEGCWNYDIFVRVRPVDNAQNTSTCGDEYSIYWGNDQYWNCGSGFHGWGCSDCCDGKGVTAGDAGAVSVP